MMLDAGELAFEESGADGAQTLWRVLSLRTWHGRKLRHTRWFITEKAAREYAAWIEGNKLIEGKVIRVDRYEMKAGE